eukprot:gene17195-23351_t
MRPATATLRAFSVGRGRESPGANHPEQGFETSSQRKEWSMDSGKPTDAEPERAAPNIMATTPENQA